MMELRHVRSSVLEKVGHDPERDVLEVRFHSGRIYRYFDVPSEVHQELMAADSLGEFFNRVIRPSYRSELVYDPQRPGVRRSRP